MNSNFRLFLILAGLNVLWGPVNLAVSTAQESMSTGAIALMRFACFGALIWIGMSIRGVREGLKIRLPKDKMAWQAVAIGFFLAAPAHALYYVAIPKTNTSETTVLNTTGPLWVALLASVILRESVSGRRWAAILLGAAGAYVVSVGWAPPSMSGGNTAGNLLYLCGTIVESLAMVLAVRVIATSSGPGTLAFQVIGAAASFAVMPLIVPGAMHLHIGAMRPETWVAMGYLIFVAGLFCFGAWYAFAERAPISLMVVSLGLQAPIGVLLGWAVRGEPLSPELVSGSVLLLVALVLAASEAQHPPEPDAMQA